MRKFFIPEVVQTSSLDCGPAALKAMLEGFGQPVSYGRLREACQTGLDGTSIDTIELVANQLGLSAEQIMLPLDHLLMPEARALPAIVVVTLAQGLTHFVVVWRRLGDWLQVMDPAVGRRWVRARHFLREVYQHSIGVNAADWLEYTSSEDFQRVFHARQRKAGLSLTSDGPANWRSMAARDAALRLTHVLVKTGAVTKGRAAQRVIERFAAEPSVIPPEYWPVAEANADEEGNPQVLMRGAVLVRVTSRRAEVEQDLSQELAATLHEKPLRPGRELLRLLLSSGGWIWPLVLLCLLTVSGGTLVEALLFRGLLDSNQMLALAGQRMGASAAVLVFCLALLLLEFPSFLADARIGRILENRLRVAFLTKLPKLSDRYFQSRPVSDMAERSHILHRMRHLPDQIRQFILAATQLVATAAGVVWLEPSAWPIAVASVSAAAIPVLSALWLLPERDLRVRTHSGGLMRFYLDAMLGLMPIRTHGAGPSIRRQHAGLLAEWTNASFSLQRAVVLTEALQLGAMFMLVASLMLVHPLAGSQVGRVLLMAYWALNMPALGQEIATITRQYPNYRSVALRLFEPLGAPDEESLSTAAAALDKSPAIEFRNVDVVASGNPILSEVSLTIEAGAHVALVGPSGAGKSTLVGLLLGWMKPSSGEILIDGEGLNVQQLRLSTAWVDPAVQLWNRSLKSNLTYGGGDESELSEVIDTAALRHVLENLPQGLQTALGENGGLVSGGEGQRVRFARALQRKDAKLVILDEPFRGLDREKRRDLLAKARAHWADATLLCITHDISETQDFDRVLVVEQGKVTEDDSPRALVQHPKSRYVQLLMAEEQARLKLWQSSEWRRIRLHSGRIVEEMPKLVNLEARESEVA